MAVVFSDTSQLWTASTWKIVDPTSYLNSEFTSQNAGVSYQASATFTPGAITVEGILLKIKCTVTVPTNTFSVQLWNSTGSVQVDVVTINASDIINNVNSYLGGWMYFKFTAPITLLAATAYSIRVVNPVNGTVNIYRDATSNNWSRGLVTSTTTSVGASDEVIITGNITAAATKSITTVTFDYTGANAYNSVEIGDSGKLICENSPAKNYRLTINNAGLLRIAHSGIFEIGNSSTRIDSTSTFWLTLNCSSNGSNGVDVRNFGTFRMYGATKIRKGLLAANAIATATSLTTNISTGWKSGDEIALAGTGASNQQQRRTLSVDASGTTLTISSGLTFAVEGTSPVQCDIMNLTSNVRILGTSSSLSAYTRYFEKSVYDCDQVEYKSVGASNTLAGILMGGTSASPISIIKDCSFWNFVDYPFSSSTGGSASVTIDGVVIYSTSVGTSPLRMSGNVPINVEIKNCFVIGGFYSYFVVLGATMVFNNNIAANANQGFNFVGQAVNELSSTASNLKAYRCTTGIGMGNAAVFRNHIISNATSFRNATGLLVGNNCDNVTFDTFTLFGNTSTNINLSGANNGVGGLQNTKFVNCSIQAGSVVTSPYGIAYTGNVTVSAEATFERCNFGTVTSHTTADILALLGYCNLKFNNCSFGSATLLSGQSVLLLGSKISLQRLNGTAGNHRTYKGYGTLTNDTVIYDSSLSSLRLTPTTALYKLQSTVFQIAVANTTTATISVKVRKSVIGDGTAYNGSQARLILKANPSAGSSYNSDIICATSTVASDGAWETLSYTLPVAVTDNVGMEFYIDCDGTTGWINIDTFTSNNNNTMLYYNNGEPILDIQTSGSTETAYTFIT